MRVIMICTLVALGSPSLAAEWKKIEGNTAAVKQAEAYCEIMASQNARSRFVFGSPDFVAGAAIGGAIRRAIERDRFIKNCMMLQGYERAPSKNKKKSRFKAGGY